MATDNSTMILTDSYWNMLKGLSNEVKLNLIARLSSSMVTGEGIKKEDDNELTKRMVNKFNGAWAGDESAEDIIAIINEGKKSKETPLNF